MDKFLVTISGIALAIFTYWFFLGKKEKTIVVDSSKNEVDILVDGGYSPEVISIKKGKTTKLNFLRKDPNPCLEEIVIPNFKIRRSLPLDKKIIVEITPKQEGKFIYSCGMNMFHGKIIIY